LDDVIVFRHLTRDDLKDVIDMELAKVRQRLAERDFQLQLTDNAKEFLIGKGSNLDYGARPLRRAIENHVEDPLSEELLRGEFEGKDIILVDAVKDDEGKIRRLNFKGLTAGQLAEQPVAAMAGEAGQAGQGATAG
jgi:ATP-dependent Clp protease ATP-binding subunit ClpC